MVDSKDASVRENAICVLSEIYKVVDEDIWRVVGQVPLKVKGLLEQRFKKVKGGDSLQRSFASKGKVSPRGGGAGAGTTPKRGAAVGGQEALTKSFNPGLKNA